MIIHKIFKIYLPAVLIIAGLEILISRLDLFWYLSGLTPLVVFLAIAILAYPKYRVKALFLAITPTLFIVGIILLLSYQESALIKHFLISITGLLYLIFAENVFLYQYQPEKYQEGAIESVFGYISLLNIFLFFTSFNAFLILLNSPQWLLLIFILIISSLVLYQNFWVNGIAFARFWIYLVIFNIIILELFWSLLFLPTNIYTNGFFITVVYYIYFNLSKVFIWQTLTKKLIIRYLTVSLIALTIVIVTTPWQ